ncbi:MAG: hypothetical protein A3C70_03330 [Candidatus Zambryskibacteria bacterium RIFCSPHIGHO2_02_FULL_43_14]|uniref:Uncharacterized protein n=1 Tax=Candidatus Zambryskibacteria bacterium RIFCSPHIGHO2_02_FULL_43_14 TaxID=1802748 RepID=A0A1G2TG65_9BACT|nr:MAG: hypothetical protein A2829_02555 [Candidatus Zambryskibacteria bacterium RIFCSPHIGHO2_01_FULL_43_60]OHA96276.1 MAG: hypothetical protein A3C70_03330 [Candidatus Zambryskibacteria bacterium RIFCSPHIGHO2_02_FULL_43_14]OHB04151.1 MAG: hypothetical protein A3B03_00010 [Candidatus Zambryskibacteria bacterium RIFCSPLOWO2_01_FULL_42_41]
MITTWFVFCVFSFLVGVAYHGVEAFFKKAVIVVTGLIAFVMSMLVVAWWYSMHYNQFANTIMKFDEIIERDLQFTVFRAIFIWSLPFISIGVGHWIGDVVRRWVDKPIIA